MTTFLDTLIPVVDACDACQIAYYIGGSIATIAHGVPRTTLDVDIIVELSHAQVDRFVALVDQDFYIQAADIHDAITHRSSFNLVHFASMLKIDMFVAPPRPFDLAKAQRVVEMQLTTTSTRRFRVTSPEDIVLQKLEWYALGGQVSERQWHDIQGVLRIQGPSLDIAYMHTWATQLDLDSLLIRALHDAGLHHG